MVRLATTANTNGTDVASEKTIESLLLMNPIQAKTRNPHPDTEAAVCQLRLVINQDAARAATPPQPESICEYQGDSPYISKRPTGATPCPAKMMTIAKARTVARSDTTANKR